MTINKLLSVLASAIFLTLMAQVTLVVTASHAQAQTQCPASSARTNQIGRYAYNNAERNAGAGAATCTSNVGLPSDGVRVFSSWIDCRQGRFTLVRETNGNGTVPTSVSCPDCAQTHSSAVILTPGTSANVTALFTFSDGTQSQYSATFSRSVANAMGNYTCSISNARLAGGVFGGELVPPAVTISALTPISNGRYRATITLSEPAGGGTAFELADLALTNATASLAGAGTAFTATLTPASDGTIGLGVPARAFQDASGNESTAGAQVTTVHISQSPIVSIGDLTAVGDGRYTSAITLSEPAGNGTRFTADDLIVSNASAALSGAGTSFTATLTPQRRGAFSLAVGAGAFENAQGTANAPAPAVTATHTGGGPSAEIIGLPEQFAGPFKQRISVVFSAPVTGFSASGIKVGNGSVGRVSGSGTTYWAQVTATGRGDLTVSVRAGAAQDAAGAPNAASQVYRVVNHTADQTRQQIAAFMASRANNLASNQPDLECLLGETCQGGTFDAQVTRGQLSFNFASARQRPVWMSVVGARSKTGLATEEYYLATFGAHTYLNPATLVGAMAQVDYQSSRTGAGSVAGYGWMLGPYLVAKLPNQPLVFEASALWGRTHNQITPFGTYTDRFETERLLIRTRLSGALEYSAITLKPFASLSYTSDSQQAYHDSLGNLIGAQTVTMSQIAVGLDFTRPLAWGTGAWVLDGGISAVHAHTSVPGGAAQSFDGPRGRIHLGVSRALGTGQLSISGFYDGIGTKAYEAYGLEVALNVTF